MSDVEVHIELAGQTRRVGTLRRQARRGGEAVVFEYHEDWLAADGRFSLEPALVLGRGAHAPAGDRAMFGSIGDSAPDSWGRQLMRRAERRLAEREGRALRALSEADYLLGVADASRLGALRFRRRDEEAFQAPVAEGVPRTIELGRLLGVTERILRNEETDEDLRMIFAPGSSLGGARPKASVLDQHGRLAIAKFPKEGDEYGIESWEEVALRLAGRAGIRTAEHQLVEVDGKPVLLSRRFDRGEAGRIPFLSALSMMGLADGERGSYPELVDLLGRHGANARADAAEIFRRMTFNVLVSNVDDHLRNHGFLWSGQGGWSLSPAYDLNPVPTDVKERVLSTSIDLEDGTCDLELVLSTAEYFGIDGKEAVAIVKEVATATATWREIARTVGMRKAEIERMGSAFEHDDLKKALAL
ncbi:serine/threonine-protein kinase HipA [Tistlia consotensis]|uniref:Serine/threonine-protein kinase HipA n=1 Tax=Tistlia consotensis USBA 355 TaxID=560819 RepID=A0A1Y6BW38_9PROT|nr:type II toxin-antitoxin system HipA family toxin [Tistlia consotensis]SMF28124.1 serine/threonine-protein kinase HipA [Tistlia consotensis USBA 355]SNR65153.1 serine/threonine-protein kinase HipA [Tistlia consotensis]